MDILENVLHQQAQELEKYKTIQVKKHIQLEFDLGHLLAVDNNELDVAQLSSNNKDHYLQQLARDNVQLLFNEIWTLPTERREEAIVVKLPTPAYVLPRARRIPKPKKLTKWQEFAKAKGIVKKKKLNVSWDDQLKKWVPVFGFKRASAQAEKDWLLEVPENADPMEDQFAKKAEGKTERVAKNELQRLRNIARSKNIKVPRMGFLPEVSSSKDLAGAITVAKASTSSLGKFQTKLPNEKEARGVSEITPGASRKRKLPPISGDQEKSENLNVVDNILNKRPKIQIEKTVNNKINEEHLMRSEENMQRKHKAGRRGTKPSSSGTKPKSGKGQRAKGKGGSGRKRR